MAGESNLKKLLATMSPKLLPDDYVFITVQGQYGDYEQLSPLASFVETEGLSLIITCENAEKSGFDFESVYKAITLSVHSSLNAVGLTAAISTKLAEKDISANVVAGYFHDHIFVPSEKANLAMDTLRELSS